MEDYQRSNEMFDQGSKLSEPSAADLVNWGNIYFATQQPKRAIEFYRQSIKIDSTYVQAYFNLAASYAGMGYPADSIKQFLYRALNVDPNFEPAKRALEQFGGD